MSLKSLAMFFFPVCLLAQPPSVESGVGSNPELRGARPGQPGVQFVDQNRFGNSANSGGVDSSLDSESPFRLDGLTVDTAEQRRNKPISGLVSVQQLQHPPSKKAVHAAEDAQKYSKAHETQKAIRKLEEAIKIEPSFREAHGNLGVEYARMERFPEAMAEFQTALDIGPPDVKTYSNLAFCYIRLGQFRDAESFARKALSLDPANGPAQTMFRIASTR